MSNKFKILTLLTLLFSTTIFANNVDKESTNILQQDQLQQDQLQQDQDKVENVIHEEQSKQLSDKNQNDVVALIDDKKVLLSEVVSFYDKTLKNINSNEGFYSYEYKIQKKMIESFCDQLIIYKNARQANYHLQKEFLEKREAHKKGYIVKSYVDDIDSNAIITNQEINDQYDKILNFFKDKYEVKFRHILTYDKRSAEKLKKKINQHNGNIKEFFIELANTYSMDDATNKEGGEMSEYINPQSFKLKNGKTLADILDNIKIGEVLNPVQSDLGWHIILLTDKKQASMPAKSDLSDTIIQSIKNQKIQDRSMEIVKEYDVKIIPVEKYQHDTIVANVGDMDIRFSDVSHYFDIMFRKQYWDRNLISFNNNIISKFIMQYVTTLVMYDEAMDQDFINTQELKDQMEVYMRGYLVMSYLDYLVSQTDIDNNDINNKYNDLKNEFIDKKEVKIRQIVLNNKDQAVKIYNEIKETWDDSIELGQEKFSEMARKHSTDSTSSAKGGILKDYVNPAVIPITEDTSLSDIVGENPKKGVLLEPFFRQQVWYIISIDDTRLVPIPELNQELHMKIKEAIQEEKKLELIKTMKEDLDIKILI